MKNAFTAFFFDVSAAFESIGTDTSRWTIDMRTLELLRSSALALLALALGCTNRHVQNRRLHRGLRRALREGVAIPATEALGRGAGAGAGFGHGLPSTGLA